MPERERVNILMVDDQPAKLLSLRAVLADLDENLLEAGSANDALKVLLETDVAVVLVDVCMPRMDGFELAELIRGHPRFQRVAIIFISAVHLTDADRLRGYGLGAVDYIPVPIIPEVLKAKVAVFAELYRKTQELSRVNTELQQRVAELDRSNERLRFADRMATIGTLSAGLGHDLGNLLLPIRVRLETLERAGLSDELAADVRAIKSSAQYLQRLANGLRLLAANPDRSGQGEATDLLAWWEDVHPLLKSVLPLGIRLIADPPAEPAWVGISRAGLTQAVFNLVQNAGDAMRERGHGVVTIRCATAGPEVILTVADNGPGMSGEVKRRCMEPYFTTKTRSIATGFGLALVYGLVKDSAGTVDMESELGTGTTFRLRFAKRPAPRVDGAPVNVSRRTAYVDIRDARLRAFAAAELRSLSFQVRYAEEGSNGADLLLVEPASSGVTAKNGAHVIIVGQSGESTLCAGEPADPSPGAIRRALRRFVTSDREVT